jgi:hypothetical protein
MDKWGADLYGDPCRGCGFDWTLDPAAAIAVVRDSPERYADRLRGATGRERIPELTWTSGAYVCHVVDNLRIWAERLAAGYLDGAFDVVGYDSDRLAEARRYAEVPLAGALWSMRWAVGAWVEAIEAALAAGVVLRHRDRGAQRAEDVARNNAHDVWHHGWDLVRILDVGCR